MGDGINDAPPMMAATVGMALGKNSEVTAEAAGVVVMDNSLEKVDEFMHISRRMRFIALQSAVGGMALSVSDRSRPHHGGLTAGGMNRLIGPAWVLAVCTLSGCWARIPASFAGAPPPRLAHEALAVNDLRDHERVVIAVFGDSGTGRADQREVARRLAATCTARGCDLALMLGDNFYSRGVRPPRDGVWDQAFVRKFEEPYAGLANLQFWAVAGNHDWFGGRDSVDTEIAYSSRSPRWRMPAYDYAVPRLPAWLHIYALDTVILLADVDIGQRERARDALCGAPGWRIAFGHHPVYSTGMHAGPGAENAAARDALMPLLRECDVDLYLAGHEHHQEHLVAGNLHQIVQGAAARLRNVAARPSDTPARQLFFGARYGFAILGVSPEAIDVEFFGYPAGSRRAFGSIYRATIPSRRREGASPR